MPHNGLTATLDSKGRYLTWGEVVIPTRFERVTLRLGI